MLGGGDKGAAGALVRKESVAALKAAVDSGFPRRHAELRDKYALHDCAIVAGVKTLEGL
jgi:galactokinase